MVSELVANQSLREELVKKVAAKSEEKIGEHLEERLAKFGHTLLATARGNEQFLQALLAFAKDTSDPIKQLTLSRILISLLAAQFLFCKLIEHQTEGGFWFAMLR